MKNIILALIFSIILNHQLMAQWQQTGGPNGGDTREIVKVGAVLVLSTGNGGVYKSVDNGASWQPSNAGLPVNSQVLELREHNGQLYVSMSGNGIYYSNNLAQTWTPINTGIEGMTFYHFIVDGRRIFAGNANGGVYFSSNHGATWTEKSVGVSLIQFQDFAVHNTVVYAGGSSLFKSSNNGSSWQKVDVVGLGANGVRSMTVSDNAFYVGDDNHVFVSTDDLTSWRKSVLDTDATITSMGSVGDSVFMTTSGGRFYYTKNKGESWTLVKNSLTNQFVKDVLLLDGKAIMSTSEGLYESFDGGKSWIVNNAGIRALPIEALVSKGSYLFAGTGNQGIFRSADRGESWESINTGLQVQHVSYVSHILAVGDKLIVSSQGGVYASSDNGEGWTNQLDPGINKSVGPLAFGDGKLLAAVGGTGVYISLDTAKTWSLTSGEGLNTATAYKSMLVRGDTIVLSAHSGELFASRDLGKTWANISIPGGFTFINDLEWAHSSLYAATGKGLLYSKNLGLSWMYVNNESMNINDVIIESDKIIAATSTGIYVTSVGRDRWYSLNAGIGNQAINKLMLYDNSLYAGAFASSIWKRPLSEIMLEEEVTPTGNLKDYKSGVVSIYPNPTTDKINVIFQQQPGEGAVLQLQTLTGKLILQKKLEQLKVDTNYGIEVRNLPAGMYLLRIITAKGVKFSHKLMIR